MYTIYFYSLPIMIMITSDAHWPVNMSMLVVSAGLMMKTLTKIRITAKLNKIHAAIFKERI